MKLGQRIIIKFARNESLHANQILRKRETHFGENTDTLRTVRFSVAEFHRGHQDCHDQHRNGRSPLDYIGTGKLAMIGKSPFESARSISPPLKISHGAVLHDLHETVRLKSFHLRSVPHP
jgi:hypothetical protein